MVTEHSFTSTIRNVLTSFFGKNAEAVLESSLLIQYLNEKTKSANRGSKARGSFANLYSIYVVVEDYINHGYHKAKKGIMPTMKALYLAIYSKGSENYPLAQSYKIIP